MARRGENIRKRADGRWEGRYTLQTAGGKKSRSVYARTYTEVKSRLQEAKQISANARPETGSEEADASEACLFGDMAAEWLEFIGQKRKYPTYVKYKGICEKYLSEIYCVPIGRVDAGTIESRLDRLNQADSGSLKKSVYAVLNQIIKHAEKTCHYPLKAYQWEADAGPKKNIEVFNQSEQAKLLHVLHDDMDICKAGIILCLSTGLRLGEICALKWSDIDREVKVLHVNSTVQRIAAEGCGTKTILYESEPKSACSVREIPLAEDVMDMLRAFPSGCKYFLNKNKPMEPRTYQNKLKSYLAEAGIPDKNFHALRHTFATNCIGSGMDVKSLSEILGHADVQITLNRYVHPSIDSKRQHMNRLSAVYGQFLGQIS